MALAVSSVIIISSGLHGTWPDVNWLEIRADVQPEVIMPIAKTVITILFMLFPLFKLFLLAGIWDHHIPFVHVA